MSEKRWVVMVDDAERTYLNDLISKGKRSARAVIGAQVLLKAAEGWTDTQIAEALPVCVRTVERLRRRSVEEGVEAALQRRRQLHRKAPRLALDPRGDGGRYRGIVVVPGAWVDVERSGRKTKVDWTLRAERGELSLRTLALVMPLGWRDVRAKATLDGQPVDMAPDVRKWNLDLIFPDGVRLAEGAELVVRLKEA